MLVALTDVGSLGWLALNRGGLKPTEALATLANAVKISISQLENPLASFVIARHNFFCPKVFNKLIYEQKRFNFSWNITNLPCGWSQWIRQRKKNIINDSVFISKLITHSSSGVISTSHLKLFLIFLLKRQCWINHISFYR